jgi:hypothetical protein
VFSVVVVPWHVVEIQKREHRIAVLLQALDNFPRGFTYTESIAEASQQQYWVIDPEFDGITGIAGPLLRQCSAVPARRAGPGAGGS